MGAVAGTGVAAAAAAARLRLRPCIWSQPVSRSVQTRALELVHGLAMLMLDGQVPSEPALIEAVVDASVL